MKIIAFSDVHGNQYAFNKFMESLRDSSYEYLFFCGDIYGYYYGQNEIINQLKKIEKLYAVRGNHDEMAIQIYDKKLSLQPILEKYGHSYTMLKKDNIEYVRRLPLIQKIEIDNKIIGIMHGTPNNLLEGRLYPKDKIEDIQSYASYDYIFCGHTHFQMIRKCGKTMIMNAGSIGQQRDGKGFCYLEFSTEMEKVSYKQIVFDRRQLVKEVERFDPYNRKMISILYRDEKN